MTFFHIIIISERPLHLYVNQHRAIEAVAFYILNENIRPGQPDFQTLKRISKDVFLNESRADEMNASIASYFLKSESEPEPTKENETRVINGSWSWAFHPQSFHRQVHLITDKISVDL